MDSEIKRLKQRVETLEQAIDELTPDDVSRRKALKALGVVGAGSVLGAGTASADSHTDQTPNVGQPDNPVDVFADSVEADAVRTSGRLTRNQPTNLDNLNANDDFAAFKAGDTNYTLVLQIADDDYSSSDGGYAATIQYVTESGERIATTSADRTHNHWGVYTRGSDFDGVDRQPEKRLSIDGGSEVVSTDWQKVNAVNLKPSTDGNGAFFRAIPEAGNDAGFPMYQGTGNLIANLFYDASRENVRIQNYAADTADFFELKGTGEVDNHGHPQENFVTESGTTSGRPSSPEHGQQYFDDDLGQPIWYDGGAGSWVDATGSQV